MKKEFTFYEFVGIISPGVVLLLILSYIFPDLCGTSNLKDISIGGMGIIVIIAYVLGHLVQSIGNLLEKIWWGIFNGMPTNWVIASDKKSFLSSSQIASFPDKIKQNLKIDSKNPISSYEPDEWFAITKQIYAAVKQANAADRIDTFNGNYGFFRGIAASLFVGLTALIIDRGLSQWQLVVIVMFLLVLAIARMHRFGKHYARELFVQFLQIKESKDN